MPVHDLAEGREVRRATGRGAQKVGDFAEVAGAEDTGGNDGEQRCGGGVKVVEAMHGAAGNHEDPAGAYLVTFPSTVKVSMPSRP